MSTTVKTGWLKDKNGDKFAPKTLISQVQTNDGILLEDKIQADLEEAITNVSIDVDTELSPTSTNPVANSTLNAEFEAITAIMNTLEGSIAGKANSSHTHNISDVTDLQSNLDTINNNIAQKSQVQIITWEADD